MVEWLLCKQHVAGSNPTISTNQVHLKHRVKGEGATASDVLALARLMRNRVLFRFGIALEPEVCGIAF